MHGEEQPTDAKITDLTGPAFAVRPADLGFHAGRVTNMPTALVYLQVVDCVYYGEKIGVGLGMRLRAGDARVRILH